MTSVREGQRSCSQTGGACGLGVQGPGFQRRFAGWGCGGTGWASPRHGYRGRGDCPSDPRLLSALRLRGVDQSWANSAETARGCSCESAGAGGLAGAGTGPGVGGCPAPPLRGVRAMLPGSDGGSRARRCCLSALPACRGAGDRRRLLRSVTCPGVRARAREGFVQKSQERVESGNKRHPSGSGKVAFACG